MMGRRGYVGRQEGYRRSYAGSHRHFGDSSAYGNQYYRERGNRFSRFGHRAGNGGNGGQFYRRGRPSYGSSYGRGMCGSYDSGYYREGGYGRGMRTSFWNRNDGYSNYYGSEEDETGTVTATVTSKILSGLSGLVSKAKPSIRKRPEAQSSNLTFNSAVKNGEYVTVGIGADGVR